MLFNIGLAVLAFLFIVLIIRAIYWFKSDVVEDWNEENDKWARDQEHFRHMAFGSEEEIKKKQDAEREGRAKWP